MATQVAQPKKYRYQNISDTEQTVIGIGIVPKDGIIEVDELLNNPNFKLLQNQERMVGVDPVTKPKK